MIIFVPQSNKIHSMKKISRFAKVTAFLLATVPTLPAAAQEEQKKTQEEGFQFTTVKENPITTVKNQNRSSTCWSFSSIGFFESELLRLGKGEYDLSEMFVVHKTMEDRAERTVRLHGDVSFSPGGSFFDVAYCWRNYGMVPQEVMPGILYGDTLPTTNLMLWPRAISRPCWPAIPKSSPLSGRTD